MSDIGSGDGGLGDGGGGSGLYGYSNADAELRAADAQRPVPYRNTADRATQWLPRVAALIGGILALAWLWRAFGPG